MARYGSLQLYNGNNDGNSQGAGGIRLLNAAAPVTGNAGSIVSEIVRAGEKLPGILAREYDRRQTEAVADHLLTAEWEFEKWKKDYNQTHQGIDAATAQADYLAAWADIAGRHAEQFDGATNEKYAGELNRGFYKTGLGIFREGGTYELNQAEKWNRSRLAAREAAFMELVANNPEDTERIRLARDEVLASYELAHPGLDPGEFIAKLDAHEIAGRMESFTAAEDVSGLAGMIAEKKAETGGMPANVQALIRQTARKYNIPEELALAQAMQESSGNQACVSHAGAIGVMQLMPGTARELGVNPHNVAENIEGGLRYLARLRDKYGNYEDALYAYNMGPGGLDAVRKGRRKMPEETRNYVPAILRRLNASPRLTPVQAKKAERRIEEIEAARKRRQKEAQKEEQEARLVTLIGDTTNFLTTTKDQPRELRQAAAYRYLSEIADPEMRKKAETIITRQLGYEDRLRKANAAEAAYNTVQEVLALKLSPVEARAHIRQAGLDPLARDLALRQISPTEPRPNMENSQALETALIRIDQGGLASPEERRVFALNNNLSHTQYRTLMAYKGKGDNLSLSRLKAAARTVGFPLDKYAKDSRALFRLYNQVVADLPDGKASSTSDIEKILASYIMDGKLPGQIWSKTSYGEAVIKGEEKAWLPVVEDDEIPYIDKRLNESGKKITRRNRQKMKKFMFNRPDDSKWEE